MFYAIFLGHSPTKGGLCGPKDIKRTVNNYVPRYWSAPFLLGLPCSCPLLAGQLVLMASMTGRRGRAPAGQQAAG